MFLEDRVEKKGADRKKTPSSKNKRSNKNKNKNKGHVKNMSGAKKKQNKVFFLGFGCGAVFGAQPFFRARNLVGLSLFYS